MFKRDTEQLIEFIESSEYTDIIFDFDETIVQLLVDWSVLGEDRQKVAERLNHLKERKEMWNYKFQDFLIEKYWPDMKKELDGYSLHAETDHLLGVNENQLLIEFIKENYKKYKFYIVSNNMNVTITQMVKELGLEECFHSIIWRDDVSFPKPRAEGIEKTIKDAKWKKENFLMIGDNPISDWAAAEAAGVDSIIIDMHL